MPNVPPQPPSAKRDATPAASQESIQTSVIIERRRFPRELPKPDVVELNSDSAWQAFQIPPDSAQEAATQERSDPPTN